MLDKNVYLTTRNKSKSSLTNSKKIKINNKNKRFYNLQKSIIK